MFRQRKSSQKPGSELLANFRQQFPEISASSTAAPDVTISAEDDAISAPPQEQNHEPNHEGFTDQDPTPRASSGDPWRFTPSLLDPNSFNFSAFANQPPGYYTPTPGGTTIYHPQAGDLHSPSLGVGMGLGTPLSLPTSEGTLQAGPAMMDISQFHPSIQHHNFQQQQDPRFNLFLQPSHPQPSFAPASFVHHDTGYETMDQDGSPDSPHGRMQSLGAAFNPQSPPMASFPPQPASMPLSSIVPVSADRFRFRTTLNAPTAMVKDPDETPVTYLNKGQAYSLSIADTSSNGAVIPGVTYRTFVRVSFEDEEQRQRPGVCWSLWKEGRGTAEAHKRGGKLQAVEFVEAGHPAEGDDRRTRVNLETSSFDGFSVTWTPGVNGAAECIVSVRFNFLSTDFSHSKGVKGIPVRLCAKTNAMGAADASPSEKNSPEICYCQVKLFRDHGAERKLTNDVAHIKKSIEKTKSQLAQAESGLKDFGKRKRGGATKNQEAQRQGKAPKHKRTWSMSSASSAGGGNGAPTRSPAEDDLCAKLQSLQDMFTSTRHVSLLYLRGETRDDPDLHPVSLVGEEGSDNVKTETREPSDGLRDSGTGSSLVSPTPSSMSLHSDSKDGGRGSTTTRESEKPSIVANASGILEVMGVDPAYKPPSQEAPRAIACFYVIREGGDSDGRQLHRAIYLHERTSSHFILQVSRKWGLDPATVTRAVQILENDLEIDMDDDVIREMVEGQDMKLEVSEVERSVPQPRREWEMALDVSEGDGASQHSAFRSTTGYELRFRF